MSGFRARRGGGASVRLSAIEAELLADLATQVAALIDDRGEPGDDPALDRLLPDAYRTSVEDSAEFRRFTEEELADEKVRAALALADSVRPAGPDGQTDAVRLELDAQQSHDWLRSLTDLRLTLAARLGIGGSPAGADVDQDQTVTGSDPEQFALLHSVYEWLGQLQESLVQAVER